MQSHRQLDDVKTAPPQVVDVGLEFCVIHLRRLFHLFFEVLRSFGDLRKTLVLKSLKVSSPLRLKPIFPTVFKYPVSRFSVPDCPSRIDSALQLKAHRVELEDRNSAK